MNPILAGGVAGALATMAMTVAMAAMKRRLPPAERYPLPAGEITYRILDGVAGPGRWPTGLASEAAMLAHFGFGAGVGALYGALADRPRLATAVPYGLAVWTASYLGWVPAAGLLTPAHRHPPRRSALMIAAHVVWGAGLAWAARELQRTEHVFLDERPGRRITMPDSGC